MAAKTTLPPGTPTVPPTTLPVAPVAPAGSGSIVVNTLSPPGLVVRIHADFDRNGSMAADDAEAAVRLLRPGAIILPNLDISDPSRLPAPTPGATPTDRATLLDSMDADTNGTLDEAQLTPARFVALSGIASRAAAVVARIDAKDAARIRGFITGSVGGIPVLASTLGDGTAEVEVSGMITLGFDVSMQIEALTFPGDPKLPAPTGPSPVKTNPFAAKLPKGSSGSPVFAKRAPGDVWVEVVHQDSAGKDIARPHDTALFTIAPFLLLPGTLPPKRVFVVVLPDRPLSSGSVRPGNQNFLFDLALACQAVFGAAAVPMPPNESAPFTPSTPAHTGPLYLIDGGRFGRDVWIQDEIEIGYCFAPHASMHVVLHCKRNRGLHDFVRQEMPAAQVGLYNSLEEPSGGSDSVHYGGNLEATPPIKAATPALPADAAGPAVKAHRPAPFGKILLGDSRFRKVDADYREFLIDQHVQPVLPVDTAWLDVGHVDEFISFVTDGSSKGFKMVYASVAAMTALLEECKKVPVSDGRTNFHRGKWASPDGLHVIGQTYDEISVEDLLRQSKPFNDKLRADHLVPIDLRLKAGLNLVEDDIIRIPTYFQPPTPARPAPSPPRPGATGGFQTVAQTIGTVNMLVLGDHLVIPKPFGPHMKPSDAEAVLKRVFKKMNIKAPVTLPPVDEVRWVEPGENPERLVCYYTDAPTDAERAEIINHIRDPAVPLSVSNAALVLAKAAELAAANAANPVLAAQLASVLLSVPTSIWMRLTIPDNKVDVLEAYIVSVFSAAGKTVHFADDWHYHRQEGEAHCGTNCLRELPEATDSKRWWDAYDPSVDVRYSP